MRSGRRRHILKVSDYGTLKLIELNLFDNNNFISTFFVHVNFKLNEMNSGRAPGISCICELI